MNPWNSQSYMKLSQKQFDKNIEKNATKNSLSIATKNDTILLYHNIRDIRIFRGKMRCRIIATCLYKSCIKNNESKNIEEIAKIFNIDVYALKKTINIIDSIILDKIMKDTKEIFDMYLFSISEEE